MCFPINTEQYTLHFIFLYTLLLTRVVNALHTNTYYVSILTRHSFFSCILCKILLHPYHHHRHIATARFLFADESVLAGWPVWHGSDTHCPPGHSPTSASALHWYIPPVGCIWWCFLLQVNTFYLIYFISQIKQGSKKV